MLLLFSAAAAAAAAAAAKLTTPHLLLLLLLLVLPFWICHLAYLCHNDSRSCLLLHLCSYHCWSCRFLAKTVRGVHEKLVCSQFDKSGLGMKTSLMDQSLMTSTAAIMMFQLVGAVAVIDSADWSLNVSSEY